ncbi:MAG TPA: 4Fe-4S dicluster domain-containing protein [Nitrospirota bacterium]|nr:4Fe-4S dicluster domain-containing protein [Nitrospirota bacterium]
MTTSVLTYETAASQSLVDEVMKRSGQNIKACYQCRRCAAGCPVGEQTGVTPDQLIRLVLFGDREEALNNLLVWKCVACYTCGTRCPNNIQTARINETLKHMSKEEHRKPLTPRIADFHNAFMTSTGHLGRVNEIELMAIYETKTIFKELAKGNVKGIMDELAAQGRLGATMTKKKRMHMGMDRIKNRAELKALYKKSKGR